MPKFTDTNGREWKVSLNVTSLEAIIDHTGVDVADMKAAPETCARLSDDMVFFADVLYLMCEDQAKTAGVSDADFGRGLAGDVLGHSRTAVLEAIGTFLPPEKRSLWLRLLSKLQNVQEKTMGLITAELDNPEIDQAMGQALGGLMDQSREKYLTRLRSATNSPAKPEESIPAP